MLCAENRHHTGPLRRPFPSAASPAEVQRASDAMVSNCSPTHSTPLHVLRPPKTNAARATPMSMSLSLSHETRRGRACELQHRNGRGPRERRVLRPSHFHRLSALALSEPAAPEEAFLPSSRTRSRQLHTRVDCRGSTRAGGRSCGLPRSPRREPRRAPSASSNGGRERERERASYFTLSFPSHPKHG